LVSDWLGAQVGERPADGLTATGYLQEYRVGRTDGGWIVTHVIFDNKNKLHYALSRLT
jgi:hypothetical protein